MGKCHGLVGATATPAAWAAPYTRGEQPSRLDPSGCPPVPAPLILRLSTPRYVLNEVELHPGFYVDWDPDPDATIDPLAHAYGEHCCTLLADARARA